MSRWSAHGRAGGTWAEERAEAWTKSTCRVWRARRRRDGHHGWCVGWCRRGREGRKRGGVVERVRALELGGACRRDCKRHELSSGHIAQQQLWHDVWATGWRSPESERWHDIRASRWRLRGGDVRGTPRWSRQRRFWFFLHRCTASACFCLAHPNTPTDRRQKRAAPTQQKQGVRCPLSRCGGRPAGSTTLTISINSTLSPRHLCIRT